MRNILFIPIFLLFYCANILSIGAEEYEQLRGRLVKTDTTHAVLAETHRTMATYVNPEDPTSPVWHGSWATFFDPTTGNRDLLFKSIQPKVGPKTASIFGKKAANFQSMLLDQEMAAWEQLRVIASQQEDKALERRIIRRQHFLAYHGSQTKDDTKRDADITQLVSLRKRDLAISETSSNPLVLYTSDNNPNYISGTLAGMFHMALTADGSTRFRVNWVYPPEFREQFDEISSVYKPFFATIGIKLTLKPFDASLISEKQRNYAELGAGRSHIRTPAALMYLYAHKIFPKAEKKVVCLDAGDTLPRGRGVREISDWDLKGTYGAIRPTKIKPGRLVGNLKLAVENNGATYGNSGVVVLNLARMRAENLGTAEVDAAMDDDRNGLLDEPVCCALLPQKLKLPERYNALVNAKGRLSLTNGGTDAGMIFHQLSVYKPWKKEPKEPYGLPRATDRFLAGLLEQVAVHKGLPANVTVTAEWMPIALHRSIKSRYVKVLMKDGLAKRHTWEGPYSEILKKLVQPGMTCVDAGVNYGFYSLLMARLVGHEGAVYSFEPNQEVHRYAAFSLASAGLSSRVTLHKLALSDHAWSGKMVIPKKNVGEGHLPRGKGAKKNERTQPFEAVRLDDQYPDMKMDILRMDVEGHEPALVDGAWAAICRSPNLIVMMEWEPKHMIKQGSDIQGFIQKLRSASFKFWKRDGDNLVALSDTQLEKRCPNIFLSRQDLSETMKS